MDILLFKPVGHDPDKKKGLDHQNDCGNDFSAEGIFAAVQMKDHIMQPVVYVEVICFDIAHNSREGTACQVGCLRSGLSQNENIENKVQKTKNRIRKQEKEVIPGEGLFPEEEAAEYLLKQYAEKDHYSI